MSDSAKRKADTELQEDREKRAKTKKQWQTPRRIPYVQGSVIQPGDSGIWVTCVKGREGKCVAELYDLFNDYAGQLYAETLPRDDDDNETNNIEHDIEAELASLKRPRRAKRELFTSIKLNVQCALFFRTVPPIEPVSFVQKICEDASKGKLRIKTRFAQRMTPMTLMGHASADGLEKVARQVLAPYFHSEPQEPRKFAIRTNMRNHKVSPRDTVIREIASVVGAGHSVDLQKYDLLILVEYFQNVCGMSVVTSAYEQLKRYNLTELMQIDQDPLP